MPNIVAQEPPVNWAPPIPPEIFNKGKQLVLAVITAISIDDDCKSTELLKAYKIARPSANKDQHIISQIIEVRSVRGILPYHKERLQNAAYAVALVAIVGEVQ